MDKAMAFKKLRNGVLKALKNILYICKFNIQIMLKMWLLVIFLYCFFEVTVFLELCCLVLTIQAWKTHVTSETSAHVHPAPTPTFSILKPLHGARKQSSVSTGSPGASLSPGEEMVPMRWRKVAQGTLEEDHALSDSCEKVNLKWVLLQLYM